MQVNITPKKLDPRGIKAPADKSWIIRYIIVAAVKGGECSIRNINLCDDVLACMDAAEAYENGGPVECGDSATVLRLILPSVIKKYGEADFICGDSLIGRPWGPYQDFFEIEREGNVLHVRGELKDEYSFDSGISSQFVSGLLIAGCRVKGESVSRPYIEMTREVLNTKLPFDVTVPEDKTLAAVWKFGSLHNVPIDDNPDLYPLLAVQAFLEGKKIEAPERLRYKESDRLAETEEIIREVLERESGEAVIGSTDHRIVMTAAMASQRAKVPVNIMHAECVSKSYPNFWEDFERAGGDFTVED